MSGIKNNNYWFKNRYHVWQPISWQGWAVDTLFLLVVVGNITVVVANPYSNELLWLYLNILFTAVTSLLVIGNVKGIPPK